MVIEVTVNVIGEVMSRTSNIRKREHKLRGNLRLKVKSIVCIQDMTTNRKMLKHGIAVIELRTISVLQEARQIVIKFVVRVRIVF